MEKKLDYDFAAGERCISVLNEVLEQYNRICSDTEGSLQKIRVRWTSLPLLSPSMQHHLIL